MIFTDRQLTVAQKELDKLLAAHSAAEEDTSTEEGWLREIEAAALTSQIDDIRTEIQEYEMLRSGQISFAERYSLADLPRILIQARIARGLSQSDLAAELGMKPQQVQRYEATDYMGASLAKLIAIADHLGVRTSESFTTEKAEAGSIFTWSGVDDVAWDRFPNAEMVKRNWLKPDLGQSLADAARLWFQQAAGSQFATALHRKKVRGANMPDEIALLAWQARILEIAEQRIAESKPGFFEHSETWLTDLVALTQDNDGPKLAQSLLEQHGIMLVIEPHLPGSYLDGAAMMAPSDYPVIGMTLRYDRLDNFWFVLFHELGHVFLHLFDNLHFDFFDEEGSNVEDELELEADSFALNALIPEEQWAKCLSRFALSEESVEIDAARLSIHSSIIAGRIRKERGDYTILSNLVGQGEVRRQFEDQIK